MGRYCVFSNNWHNQGDTMKPIWKPHHTEIVRRFYANHICPRRGHRVKAKTINQMFDDGQPSVYTRCLKCNKVILAKDFPGPDDDQYIARD